MTLRGKTFFYKSKIDMFTLLGLCPKCGPCSVTDKTITIVTAGDFEI